MAPGRPVGAPFDSLGGCEGIARPVGLVRGDLPGVESLLWHLQLIWGGLCALGVPHGLRVGFGGGVLAGLGGSLWSEGVVRGGSS